MRSNVLLCALGVVCASAQFAAGLEVREDGIQVHFANRAARIQFEVVTQQAASARVVAEWVDTQDQIVAQSSATVALKPGVQSVTMSTASPILDYSKAIETLALALRLRYSITTREERVEQIASLSEVNSNYLVLAPRVPDSFSPARALRFSARALNPRGFAVPDATVRATVHFTEKLKASSTVKVDASGKAAFSFDWPQAISEEDRDDLKIEFEATSGDVHRFAVEQPDVDAKPTFYVSTDKRLYQPGQTLQMRAIAFDEFGKALKGAELEFEINKVYRDLVQKVTATTSRFGIAAADWVIPETAANDDYHVTVKTRDSEESAARVVRIARYELPTFEFTAKPSPDHAKPGETITVNIDAKYLFGSPLTQGTAKIDGVPQRWTNQNLTPPGAAAVDLDEQGHAELELELPTFEFPAPWSLQYTATVTETATHREETRDFSISLREGNIYVSFAGSPHNFMLRATRYPQQGACAGCRIKLSAYSQVREHTSPAVVVAEVTTDAAGVAEASNLKLPKREDWADNFMLHWEATGPTGNGSGIHGLPAKLPPVGRIDAQHLRRVPGEPVHLTLDLPGEAESALVGIAHNGQLLDTFQVLLRNGRAELDYPYSADFGNAVTFLLAANDGEDSGDIADQVTVFYQRTQSLKIDVRLDRPQYRPGDAVHATIDVRTPDGKPVEAALGVSAIDRAVKVRAGETETAAGDAALPQTELLARFLSREQRYWGREINDDAKVEAYLQNSFGIWMIKHFKPVRQAIDKAMADGAPAPANEQALAALCQQAGIDWKAIKDPWGGAWTLVFNRHLRNISATVTSKGPRQRGPGLSFQLLSLSWFSRQEAAIRRYLASARPFPASQAEFDRAWAAAGLTPADRIDPWGHPLKIEFGSILPLDATTFAYAEYNPKQARRSVHYGNLRKVSIFLTEERYSYPMAEFVEAKPVPNKGGGHSPLKLQGRSGISGVVTDVSGAIIGQAVVTIQDSQGKEIMRVRAGQNGEFVFRGLPVGQYGLYVQSPGFRVFQIAKVPVTKRLMTPLTVVMQIGAVAETVTVEAASPLLQTESTQIAELTPGVAGQDEPEPRLRKDFLETLLWRPLLETDPAGHSTVDFTLADNITTWAFTAIASTLNGSVDSTDAEIRVFQPFFIEHNPPPTLTEGDELWLPVILRNYQSTAQDITFRTSLAPAFDLKSQPETQLKVDAGGIAEQTLHFIATSRIKDGTQRLTALASGESDAIEKKLDIRPAGHRVDLTATELFTAKPGKLVIDIPQDAQFLSASFRLNPDAASRVFQAEAAMLERPYGCGEQTISSTYPSMLILSHGGSSNTTLAKARRYLKLGYDRLLSYRLPDGGFAYFHGQPADLSITAYAIEFLAAAAKQIEVDPKVIADAGAWLEKQQRSDGTWGTPEATAHIVRVLASHAEPAKIARAVNSVFDTPNAYVHAELLPVLRKLNDPRAGRSLARIVELAQTDGDGQRWAHAGVTAFYGWGRAGDIETTAIVARSLYEAGEVDLARKAQLYLIRTQDSYGSWYSTHATIRVLEALLAGHTPNPEPLHASVSEGMIVLKAGHNEIRLDATGAARLASASVSVAYYTNSLPVATPGMSLAVDFDRTTAPAGEAIECRVRASRSKGQYGMTIAEIGLPPGVEVDRASLEANRDLYRFEVQPDRVIFYLWAADQSLTFRFRPRFPMKALQAESTFYDYYNPDARAYAAPVRFEITESKKGRPAQR